MTRAPGFHVAGQRAADFRPHAWLRGGHLQSILPSLPPRRTWTRWQSRALRACAQAWLLDCGGGVRLQAWHSANPAAGGRTAVLLHGWEGNADSCYVLSLAALLYARGYAIVRLNLRDHGRTQPLNRGLFHSCRLGDVTGALRAVAARCGAQRLYLAGFSLGGNFLLRACAEPALPASVAGVVAISPVLDPEHTLRALEQGWPVYHAYFVRRWSRSLRYKERCWPGVYDFRALLRSRSLRIMTDVLVRERTSFADSAAYLDGYSITGARLLTMGVPARILAADDDPIIPAADLERLAPTPLLRVTRTSAGGHCGFLAGLLAPAYSDRYTLAQFAAFHDALPAASMS
ncbi:MAG: alpha/beta fold hydrolase [Gammaproteobacteria bacterium]|nr:alpha/beta fold hydrolase [Gammaproteobacteria bacterium]